MAEPVCAMGSSDHATRPAPACAPGLNGGVVRQPSHGRHFPEPLLPDPHHLGASPRSPRLPRSGCSRSAPAGACVVRPSNRWFGALHRLRIALRQPGGRRLACHLEWSAPASACHTKENPQPEPGAGVLMSEGRSSPGKASVHQPSTCTVTVLTVWALGAVTVSRPSRYTAWSRSRSMATGKRKLRLQVP
jgi:hypothetical protein